MREKHLLRRTVPIPSHPRISSLLVDREAYYPADRSYLAVFIFIVESYNELLSNFQGNRHDQFKFEKHYFFHKFATKNLWSSSGGWLKKT